MEIKRWQLKVTLLLLGSSIIVAMFHYPEPDKVYKGVAVIQDVRVKTISSDDPFTGLNQKKVCLTFAVFEHQSPPITFEAEVDECDNLKLGAEVRLERRVRPDKTVSYTYLGLK